MPGHAPIEPGSAPASSHRNPRIPRRTANKVGAILPVVLILVLIFSTLGMGLLKLSSNASVETAHAVQRLQSFYAAEAGLHDALARAAIARDQGRQEVFSAGTHSWSGTNDTCTYEVTIEELSPASPPAYRIRSEGRTPANATSRMEVTLVQTNALPMALFGVQSLRIRNDVTISAPQIGSNGDVDLNGLQSLPSGGVVVLATDPHTGLPGELLCTDCGYNEAAFDVEPDPLGVFPPGLMTDVFNDQVFAATNLYVATDATNIIAAGTTPYYLDNIDVQGVLQVDLSTSSYPATILLEGSFVTTGSGIITVVGGNPGRFRIYARGTTAPIDLQFAASESYGWTGAFVYAPGRPVDIAVTYGRFSGGVWGGETNLTVPSKAFLTEVTVDSGLLAYTAFDSLSWTRHFYRLATSEWEHDYHPPP